MLHKFLIFSPKTSPPQKKMLQILLNTFMIAPPSLLPSHLRTYLVFLHLGLLPNYVAPKTFNPLFYLKDHSMQLLWVRWEASSSSILLHGLTPIKQYLYLIHTGRKGKGSFGPELVRRALVQHSFGDQELASFPSSFPTGAWE